MSDQSAEDPVAREQFLRAASLARQTSDGVQFARAALGYGGPLIWSGAGSDADLIPLLQDAIDMVGGTDSPLEVRLKARLACAWRSSPERFKDRADLSGRALDEARKLRDPETLGYALAGRFWATLFPDNQADRMAIASELLSVAEAAGDLERQTDGHLALYITFVELGMMSEAVAQLTRFQTTAQSIGQPLAVRPYQTVLALLQGDFDRASQLIEEEPSLASTGDGADAVSAAPFHRFLLRREQGRVADEETSIRESIERYEWSPFYRPVLACLLLDLDRPDEARAIFYELSRDEFRALSRDANWLLGMSLAGEACARLGLASVADVLYRHLLPFAGRPAVSCADGSVGAVDRYLGLLAATASRLNDAAQHLEDAVRVNERMGANPWAAHSRFDLAQLLERREAPGDAQRADELRLLAQAAAQRVGMSALLHSLAPIRRPSESTIAVPPTTGRKGIFRREGDYWTVGLDGPSARIRDSKGMGYLAFLLARPGTETHALDLVGALPDPSGAGHAYRAATSDEMPATGLGDAGEMLDAEARNSYRERLRDLESDLAEAEDWHDPERIARIQSERDFLMKELAAAVGLGGRSRVAASAAERARLNVGKAIRSSIQRIEEYNSALGGHLNVSIHTGTFCSYQPDPGISISWEL